jgi:hypothetical protein
MKKTALILLFFTGITTFTFAQNPNNEASIYSEAIQIVVTSKAVTESSENSILFDKNVVDFGKITRGDKSIFTFEFKNISKETLKVESVTEFHYLRAEFPKKSIAPNEKGYIKITLLSERLSPESLNRLFEKELVVLFKNKYKENSPLMSSTLNMKAFVNDL